jgi:S-adenosyl methyltransferase
VADCAAGRAAARSTVTQSERVMSADTPRARIDTSKAHPARVYDWLLGGKDNYRADWEVGESLPPEASRSARQNRQFMHRAADWLARQGIDQYLDVGTGIPTEPNLHQVVQGVLPAARVVYADNDPIVLSHAQALLVSRPEGVTDYVQSDVRDPAAILEHARRVLDFDRPLSLSLIALMHFLPDSEKPHEIVRALVDALPSGSYLVMSHGGTDLIPGLAERVLRDYDRGGMSLQPRGRADVERFFEGLELVAPGLVPTTAWYRDTAAPPSETSGLYAGVARVP